MNEEKTPQDNQEQAEKEAAPAPVRCSVISAKGLERLREQARKEAAE